VSPVKYEMGFYIPEDTILQIKRTLSSVHGISCKRISFVGVDVSAIHKMASMGNSCSLNGHVCGSNGWPLNASVALGCDSHSSRTKPGQHLHTAVALNLIGWCPGGL
jgi:hypothetical protein